MSGRSLKAARWPARAPGRFLGALLLALAACMLAACSGGSAGSQAGATVYALAGAPGRIATLQGFDAGSGKNRSTVRLKQAGASTLAMGDDGRFWVGGKSFSGLPLTSISVVSNDLKNHTRVQVEHNPGVGLAFARGKMWVASSENGFGGSVTEVDPDSLTTRTVQVPAPEGQTYILTALAASEDKIVVAGMTTGPDPQKRYTLITVIDPVTMAVSWRSAMLKNADVWQIIPRGKQFVLLNVASGEDKNQSAADIYLLEQDNVLTPLAVNPSPLWGAIKGDVLYTYHNASWNSLHEVPGRFLSIHDLSGKKTKRVDMPVGMNADDLIVTDKEILLSVKSSTTQHPAGIYAWDLDGGGMRLFAALPDAGKLFWRAARGR